jgi:hypothetical protein
MDGAAADRCIVVPCLGWHRAEGRIYSRSDGDQEDDVTAKQVGYWDYDRDAALSCPACGWNGRAADNESDFDELLDVRCPECDRMLLIVAFPTIEETRAAAAAGNRRAEADLPSVDAREARHKRAGELNLKEPHQLPELAGTEVRIDWDFETSKGEHWTVLRHQGAEIWRELAYYEGYKRFADVFEILRRRYGPRLTEVRPTAASKLYLYGDRLSSPQTIERLNASLERE